MTQKYKLALIEPTEEMWSGLARAIMMGRDLECNKAHEMRKHLERGGNEIPAWLDKELDGEKHLAKGDMTAMIYLAMTAECPTVEVVDFSTVLSNYLKDNVSTIRTPPVSPPTTIEFKEYLTQNGYKIVKVV